MKSANVLNKVVNMCGKVVGERQEQFSQLYDRRVIWRARVIADTTDMSLLNIMRFFHLVDDFVYLNLNLQSVASLNR